MHHPVIKNAAVFGGVAMGWSLGEFHQMASIFSYIAAGTFALIQAARLVRRWYLEEKNKTAVGQITE